MTKIIYFDTETTGLDPVQQDIIQLAYVIEINGVIKEQNDLRMQPFSYENIQQKALDVHGISVDEIKTYPKPQEAYRTFTKTLAEYVNKFDRNDKFIPCGYNIGNFDIPFLNQFFLKNGDKYFGSYINYKCIDPYQVIQFVHGMGIEEYDNMKLEFACKKFDIEIKAHDAMSDILATRALAFKLKEKYFK